MKLAHNFLLNVFSDVYFWAVYSNPAYLKLSQLTALQGLTVLNCE